MQVGPMSGDSLAIDMRGGPFKVCFIIHLGVSSHELPVSLRLHALRLLHVVRVVGVHKRMCMCSCCALTAC
jgi:hypothetical protein